MKISITPRASEHLTATYEYLHGISPRLAASQMRRIFDGIDQLKQFPESGHPGRVESTRELPIPRTPFLVVYSIAAQTIYIIAVLHGKQRWPQR